MTAKKSKHLLIQIYEKINIIENDETVFFSFITAPSWAQRSPADNI